MNHVRFAMFIEKEIGYFTKLHEDARRLIVSIILYNLISPIIGIFLSAFLWRQTHDIVLIAVYNVILFLAIPIGFYGNGYLLRKFSPAIPYTLSLFVGGIAGALLIFLPVITYTAIVAFGVVNGVCSGIYWANRNLFTLRTTQTDDRIYFSSIESSAGNITDVAIPFLIGWFIVLGSAFHLYNAIQAYRILILIVLVMSVFIGIASQKISIKTQSVETLRLSSISMQWRAFRLLEFILGLKEATVTFIPPLLVLILVGKEGALGTVQSVSTIFAALLIYTIGKKLKIHERLRFVVISIIITIIGGLFFSISYSALGVFILFACQAVAQPFFWVTLNSINYDVIDRSNEGQNRQYAYVCDQELYLNGGRVFGILIFIGFLLLTSRTSALRFGPLLFGATQILLYFTVKSIEKRSSYNR